MSLSELSVMLGRRWVYCSAVESSMCAQGHCSDSLLQGHESQMEEPVGVCTHIRILMSKLGAAPKGSPMHPPDSKRGSICRKWDQKKCQKLYVQ